MTFLVLLCEFKIGEISTLQKSLLLTESVKKIPETPDQIKEELFAHINIELYFDLLSLDRKLPYIFKKSFPITLEKD